MAGFISNVDKDNLLTQMLGAPPWNVLINCRLFKNNVTVDGSTILSGLVEADYSSYSPQALGSWASPSGGGGGTSASTNAGVTFNPGVLFTPQDCYGWYLTDGSGNLVGCGNFGSGPRNMGGTVTSLTIVPTLSLS